MWGLLRRSFLRKPFYRTVTVPVVSRRHAHGENEPYTEGPNGFMFNEKVRFRHYFVRSYPLLILHYEYFAAIKSIQ